MQKVNRTIENTWKMLQYLYDELAGRKFRTVDITGIEDLDSLYALIISKWCATLATEGLYKEYVTIENEEMTSPRGQINVQETISRQSKMRGSIICSYDELSEDININHILKGTLQYLLNYGNIDEKLKNEITKTMQMFSGIGYIDINEVHWNDIRFNNNNIRYKHLIEICRTLMAEHKLKKTSELTDNQRLYILFKKQVYKWFKNTYGDEDDVYLFEKPFYYNKESALETNINKTQKIIAVSTGKYALLVCVRLQDKELLEDSTLSRKHKEILIKHIRDFLQEYKVKAFGCVIYVNTDKTKLNLQPITVNAFKEFMIGEITVDIHDQWRFIEAKLKDVYKYFIARNKSKTKNRGNNIGVK